MVEAYLGCLPRSRRFTWGSTVVDEYDLLFECPAYDRIRFKYEDALFSKVGGVPRIARSVKLPGKVIAFTDQDPRKVAAFVSECLDYRRFEAPDLHPYLTSEMLQELSLADYKVDTLLSDYDDYVDGFGFDLDAHGAYFGSLSPPPPRAVWGQRVICDMLHLLMLYASNVCKKGFSPFSATALSLCMLNASRWTPRKTG